MSTFVYNLEEYATREILNGKEFWMSPKASTEHNRISNNISRIFNNYLWGKKCEMFDNVEVFLTKKDTVVPDVIVVCNPEIIKHKGIYGTPELIVEILSPSTTKHDTGYKKDLYERCGVAEYWIVDPANLTISVYLLKEDRYYLDNVYVKHDEDWIARTTQENRDAIIYEFKTTIFDDLIIKVEDVFHNVKF